MLEQLTPQQLHVLDADSQELPRLVDPRNNTTYVLVNATEYDAIKGLIDDEVRQANIRKVALRNAVGRMSESP